MMHELSVRIGKQQMAMSLAPRSVILCDNTEQAQRMAAALRAAGATLIDGSDGSRGRVGEQLPKRIDASSVQRIRVALRLDEDILDWRPRDSSALQCMLSETLVALAGGADLLVFDLSPFAASPFDTAHACAFMRRVATEFMVTVAAVVSDAALIASAGAHLIVCTDDGIVEAGDVGSVLASPRTDVLRQRLEATPIASPVAMQMRRVQRASVQPVNYAHTTIIQLPTQDSIALAGGDE